MNKNIKISSKQFDLLKNIGSCIKKEGVNAKKLKYALLDSIEEAMGDTWYNLKKSTRDAIDYVCFLSVERGYFYASPKTIAERYGLSKSTVYEAIKTIRDAGLIFKVNRVSRKQNGLGSPVHIFVGHPNFNSILELLGIEWKANQKADWKAENAENPTESSDTSDSETPTYNLPTSSNELNNMFNNQYNVTPVENTLESQNNDSGNGKHADKKKWIKYVPNMINKIYANIFGDNLLVLWRKITSVAKTVHCSSFDKNDVLTLGRNVLQFLMNNDNFSRMSLDEMCAYVYKSMRDSIYNMLGNDRLEDIVYADNGEVCIVNADGELIPTTYLNTDNFYDNSIASILFGHAQINADSKYIDKNSYHATLFDEVFCGNL